MSDLFVILIASVLLFAVLYLVKRKHIRFALASLVLGATMFHLARDSF